MKRRKHTRRAAASLLGSVACGLLSSCTSAGSPDPGTPLPDPPDFKTPNAGLIFNAIDAVAQPEVTPTTMVIAVVGPADSVDPRAPLWLINLDSASAPLVTVPRADGSFAFMSTLASVDDRLRLVSRRDDGHSAPLDAQVRRLSSGELTVGQPNPSALPCFSLVTDTPDELVADADGEVFTLTNACSVDVSIEDLRLRFDDQGFALSNTVNVVPAGARVPVRVIDQREPDGVERGDIVLVRVSDGANVQRFALGVYSLRAP